MSKLQDNLRTIHVSNNYDITADGHPMVHYAAREKFFGSRWVVTVKGRRFKNVAWYEHNSKWFHCTRETREQVFNEVMAFVQKMFPGMEMVKSPVGGWVPKADLDAVKLKLKEKKECTNELKK